VSTLSVSDDNVTESERGHHMDHQLGRGAPEPPDLRRRRRRAGAGDRRCCVVLRLWRRRASGAIVRGYRRPGPEAAAGRARRRRPDASAVHAALPGPRVGGLARLRDSGPGDCRGAAGSMGLGSCLCGPRWAPTGHRSGVRRSRSPRARPRRAGTRRADLARSDLTRGGPCSWAGGTTTYSRIYRPRR
jgi:hypothetical protein